MKTILSTVFLASILSCSLAQNFNSVVLTWDPATNQLDGSLFQVWVGSAASHNYSRHYPVATNQFTFTADMLNPGLNYVCISQLSTNPGGMADLSALSGEVQILKAQWVTVSPVITNETIEVSTNLGANWQCAGANLVEVPASEAAQQFYRARAEFTITITRTNYLSLPAAP